MAINQCHECGIMPLLKTMLEGSLAKAPWGKIYDGPISRLVYSAFFNTYIKFCTFITKCTIVTNFLLCRLTKKINIVCNNYCDCFDSVQIKFLSTSIWYHVYLGELFCSWLPSKTFALVVSEGRLSLTD